ncbi:MAG: alpha/beta hydrolase [Flavobacteriales bacterium]|nr:alpha/beta hydrolase [Flavobacteriales bacterium]
MRKTLKIGRITWSYIEHGSGDELWLAFHGFGQDACVMSHFMQTFRPNAKVLSFDLPLHGQTVISGKFRFTSDHLLASDIADLLGHAIRENGGKSCSLVGFSLGGKMVLKLVELVPGKIDRLVLIAPDGLKVNPLYRFCTHTKFGRFLFKFIIRFPQPLLASSWLISSVGLMNKKIHQFVNAQMGTREKRQKVFDTWVMFKELTPNLKDVRSKIWRYHIKPTLIFGTKDRVIHPKLAKKLSGDNCSSAGVIILETGHNLTTKEHAEYLREMIL